MRAGAGAEQAYDQGLVHTTRVLDLKGFPCRPVKATILFVVCP